MRMASFILGSLAGAAATVYLYKNKDRLFNLTTDLILSGFQPAASSSQSSQRQAGAQPEASAKQDLAAANTSHAAFATGTTSAPANNGLDEVRQWVAKDPNLSATVQEILQHNNEQSQAHH
ncbi:hypothetical protein [Paenibacillus senegalensis]|uniref:hypothetical protein n=1 Tax=Paenibacillus senegalensis TaxID=1465766 RepID=UPI000288B085|nr:hypothetical protein [Paenibacillus senegalensis]